MNFDFSGKTVIITGATGGIGKKICEDFLEKGAFVIGIGRNDKILNKLKDLYKEEFDFRVVDFIDSEQVEKVSKELTKTYKKIDILINCAGIVKDNLFIRMSYSDWDDVLKINLYATVIFTKNILKKMFRNKKGKIVTISSVIGLYGNPGQANYAASKGAINSWAKSLAKEYGNRNININVIAPGFIETKMTDSLEDNYKTSLLNEIPLKRFGKPKDISNLALFLSSDYSDYINGQIIKVDGGLFM